MKIDDPHAALRERVLATVVRLLEKTLIRIGNDEYARTNHSYGFNEHWALEPTVFANYAKHYQTGAPMPQALVEKIHRHAYRVTDEDLATLQATYGDDRLFEIVVSAALGASRARLVAGLQALEEA